MSIGSVNRVVMRKLASSKIFDLIISEHRSPHIRYKGVDMSFLNRTVSKFLKDESIESNMEELARAGHIFKSSIKGTQRRGSLEYTIIGNFYEIEFHISTEELSQGDLEQVLDLGFYFSKWKSYFKEWD